MEDLFKKFLYTSVGLVSYTAEKMQEAVDRLVGEGKLSAEEGKRLVDDFVKNTEGRKNEFEGQLRAVTERVVNNFNFASSSEVQDLKARIASLEARLMAEDKVAKKGATSK